jgi:hypothetical protein
MNMQQTRRVLTGALLTATLVSGAAMATYVYPGKICVQKFYDRNANGIWNSGEPLLSGWPMTLDPGGITKNTVSGQAIFVVAPGTYSITEGTPIQTNWYQSAPRVGGVVVNPLTGIHVYSYQTKTVKFGNYCKKPSGGKTPGFWSNKNGEATMNDDGGNGPELQLLRDLNLVDADGNAFDPTTYGQFNTWLLDSTAVNMAYKLSSHLAAMRLNVEAGFVSGNAFYFPAGMTINNLMNAANASLLANPLTIDASAARTQQEQLKNALDALNNGANVIPYSPCTKSFYTPPPY